MRSILTMAVLAAATLPLAPAAAQTMHGYAARATRLYAGPLREYPSVRSIGRGAKVRMHGCLRDWSWCDVTYRANRGWIPGDALRISHNGRRRRVAAQMGIGVVAFSFGPYWDSHYRARTFYDQRDTWQTRYQTEYRPEWGERERTPERKQHGDEGRFRYRWSADSRPRVEDFDVEAPLAPYAFPDHSLEPVRGQDPAINAGGQAMGNTAQPSSPDSGDPARNSQP